MGQNRHLGVGEALGSLMELSLVLRPQGILGFSVRNLEEPSPQGQSQEVVPLRLFLEDSLEDRILTAPYKAGNLSSHANHH